MKILIVSKVTGRYLKSFELEYTTRFEEALDFLNEKEAKQFCKAKGLTNHKLIAKSQRLGMDLYLSEC